VPVENPRLVKYIIRRNHMNKIFIETDAELYALIKHVVVECDTEQSSDDKTVDRAEQPEPKPC